MKRYEAGKMKRRVLEPLRASRNCIHVDNTNTHVGKYLNFPQLLSQHSLSFYAGFISSTSEHPISHELFFSKIDTATI